MDLEVEIYLLVYPRPKLQLTRNLKPNKGYFPKTDFTMCDPTARAATGTLGATGGKIWSRIARAEGRLELFRGLC